MSPLTESAPREEEAGHQLLVAGASASRVLAARPRPGERVLRRACPAGARLHAYDLRFRTSINRAAASFPLGVASHRVV